MQATPSSPAAPFTPLINPKRSSLTPQASRAGLQNIKRTVPAHFFAASINRSTRRSTDCHICCAHNGNDERGRENMVEWCENGIVPVVSAGSHGGICAKPACAGRIVGALQ
jgi:hypothetical protein